MPNPISLKGLAVVLTLLVATTLAAPLSALRAAEASAPANTQPSSADDPYFFFRSARDRSKVKLVGQAWIKKNIELPELQSLGDDVLRLNDDNPAQAGAAWYTSTVSIDRGFETVFDVAITNKANDTNNTFPPAGDGFAFVIQNDAHGKDAIGEGGCSGGYAGIQKKITNSFAIEFDTYPNPPFCITNAEPNYPHVGLLANGQQAPILNQIRPNIASLLDQRPHTIRIRYTTGSLEAPEPLLEIFLDDMSNPILGKSIDLSDYVSTPDGRAWVGFVAGTGTYDEANDIRNWYFRSGRDLNCGLEYDFTSGYENQGKRFSPNPEYSTVWASQTGGNGWQSVNGQLSISQGYGQSSGFLAAGDGLDPTLRNLVFRDENPQPIEQFKLTYTWQTSDGNPPTGHHLKTTIKMKLLDQSEIILDQLELTASEAISLNGEMRLVNVIQIPSDDIARALKPQEFYIKLNSSDTADVIRLKALAVCINTGADVSSRPPVIPFGGDRACDMLLTKIRGRWQPFGDGVPKQLEFDPSKHTGVTLEPYPEYSLEANGYPNWLNYDPTSWARMLPSGTPAPKLVPCVFMKNGQFYDPEPLPPPPFETTPPSRNQIVRFTAIDGTPATREMLGLLNYAAYFAVGSGTWCYSSDNVFDNLMRDRANTNSYGSGYNVASPKYDCDTLNFHQISDGPCGTFVGSLFRAMGYFDVDAIAAAYEQADPDNKSLGLYNLYSGPVPYNQALPRNRYGRIDSPLVLRDENDQPIPITYTGIRTYPYRPGTEAVPEHFLGPSFYGQPLHPVHDCPSITQICDKMGGCKTVIRDCETTPGECIDKEVTLDCRKNPGECTNVICAQNARECERLQVCADARIQLNGHWNEPTHNELSPLNKNTNAVADDAWKQIKPGDIAITIVETDAGLVYTHIQVVVGWGPGPQQQADTTYVRYGMDLYPTYASLTPAQQQTFVPYVMDRYSSPGTGGVTGPRPFSLELWHTATDFWISSPTQ
jgi:hypothetical protein